ncbi:MAG TPA: hypothetical protein VM734_27680 [Kofleriaceae bacterium]|jgi:hypothetical protein|nr:hypothetical protein [Kofleriaceae bacterium]
MSTERMRGDQVGGKRQPPPVIGGVLEDESVASTMALYEALRRPPGSDLEEVVARLRSWREEVMALLDDLLGPDEARSLFDALLRGQIVRRADLATRVEQVLRANIELVRAGG